MLPQDVVVRMIVNLAVTEKCPSCIAKTLMSVVIKPIREFEKAGLYVLAVIHIC